MSDRSARFACVRGPGAKVFRAFQLDEWGEGVILHLNPEWRLTRPERGSAGDPLAGTTAQRPV